MNARRVGLLFAIGIVTLAIAAWVSSRPSARNSIAGTAVLPGLESSLNTVTRIRIVKSGHLQATLERRATDWEVAERGYPADSGKLRKLLLDLGSLKAIARKTRLAHNYPVLGVQEVTSPKASGARVDLISPGKTWSLIVGHSRNGDSVYVRPADSNQSLLATPLILVDADPKLWLDPTLLDIDPSRVSAITEQPAKGPGFEVAREKGAQADFTVHGIPRGRELTSANAADSMGSALSSLTLTDVRKAALPPPNRVLTHAIFSTFDGLEVAVSGYKSAGADYIDVSVRATLAPTAAEARRLEARVQDREFEIPDYRYAEIFQSLDGLLKPQPVKKIAASKTHPHAKRNSAKASS